MLVVSQVLPHPSNCWGESLGDSSRDGVQCCTAALCTTSVQSRTPPTPAHPSTPQPHTLTLYQVTIAPSSLGSEAEGLILSSTIKYYIDIPKEALVTGY